MQVVEQTATRLTLRDRILWLYFASALVLGIGLVILPSGQLRVLTCQRLQPQQTGCEYREQSLLSSSVRSLPLHTIQGATLDRHRRRKKSDTYAVVLRTSSGNITLTSHESNYSGRQAIADRINNFLMDTSQPGVQFHSDQRLSSFLIGIAVMGGGTFLLLFVCKVITCTLDQNRGMVTIHRKALLRTEVEEYPLSQVREAIAELSTNKKTRSAHIVLELKSGTRVPLTHLYSFDVAQKQQVALLMNSLINGSVRGQTTPPDLHPTAPVHLTPEQKLEQDIAQWQQTIQNQPDDAEAHFKLGMALYKQKQREAARNSLQQAKQLFDQQDQSDRVMQVQDMLWRLGLE